MPKSHLTAQTNHKFDIISRRIYHCTMRFSATVLLASSVSAFAPSLQYTDRSSSLFAKPKVFIDGEAGTTGLQVRNRLASRDDLEIISPPSELRKDPDTRKKFINEADAVILCKFWCNADLRCTSSSFCDQKRLRYPF